MAEPAPVNEKLQKADEYLAKHRILELFNDLCASVCFEKPQDVRSFLLQQLQTRELEGMEAGFFEEKEIEAVFALADLMQTGVISDKQAREALLSMANSQKQKDDCEAIALPDEVDLAVFKVKAKEALKIH
mmetsp:Transcript_129033/g.275390  ORF Transcript_129033/g.275390 Transcript_129033/m.275390 type:complete len:131 (-) Transcript_129033:151-543(-)